MSNLPLIRIKDAWLLRQNASFGLNELWGDGEPLESDEYYADIADSYKKAWAPYNDKVLAAMTELTGLSFTQNVIDVYIAPWFSAFSEPMVLGVTSKPDEFVDLLTHELLHRLLSDNTSIPNDYLLLDEWAKIFGEGHSVNTLIHIPVHALHQAIYLDVLHAPEKLERNISYPSDDGNTDYADAWAYVGEHGCHEIITRLKQSYQALARSLA